MHIIIIIVVASTIFSIEYIFKHSFRFKSDIYDPYFFKLKANLFTICEV